MALTHTPAPSLPSNPTQGDLVQKLSWFGQPLGPLAPADVVVQVITAMAQLLGRGADTAVFQHQMLMEPATGWADGLVILDLH